MSKPLPHRKNDRLGFGPTDRAFVGPRPNLQGAATQPVMLSAQWRQPLLSYQRLFVAFSGGLDSSVLLHVLISDSALFERVQAIHVHHGLSQNACKWQQHCEQLCLRWGIPLHVRHIQCPHSSNLEATARAARYRVFDEMVSQDDALLLAHHADDQAETVLLQLSRGAGIDGLCAMWPARTRETYQLLRPLLAYSKQDLLAYAIQHQLQWVEDESNQTIEYRRNYLRHEVLPRLAIHWPQVNAQLAQVAAFNQQASANLLDLACIDYPALLQQPTTLPLNLLDGLKPHRVMNLLWCWLRQHPIAPLNVHGLYRVMNELVTAQDPAGKRVSFVGVDVWCYQRCLHVVPKQARSIHHEPLKWDAFPAPLVLPDARGQLVVEGRHDALPTCDLEVRFRVGGEHFYWHGQTKSLKKYYQVWRIPPWQRDEVPLLYANGELVQVVGYAVGDRCQALGLQPEQHIVWERSSC